MTLQNCWQRVSWLSFGGWLAAAALPGWLIAATWRVRGQGNNAVVVVSAATFKTELAPEAIAAAFGKNLAMRSESATRLPLPTQLAGTTVLVDNKLAQLFFVSPGQVNFLIPPDTRLGKVNVVISSGTGEISAQPHNTFVAEVARQG